MFQSEVQADEQPPKPSAAQFLLHDCYEDQLLQDLAAGRAAKKGAGLSESRLVAGRAAPHSNKPQSIYELSSSSSALKRARAANDEEGEEELLGERVVGDADRASEGRKRSKMEQ